MQLEDFLTIDIADGIATLWLDHQHEKMNVVSPEVILLLEQAFDELQAHDAVEAIVIISRKKDFIAGADIKSFAIEQKGDFRPHQARGHASLKRLEESRKPVVAAIHGTAYGLGTELALACHVRVASNHPSTKFALPEVKLGLLPGGGGTQRLPRRIGIQKALPLMLTGKNVYAYQAKKLGLVDALTDVNKLHRAAVLMAKRQLTKPLVRKNKGGLLKAILEHNRFGRSILFAQARKQALKQSQGNYPAIPAILDCVETGYQQGIEAGYEKELELFEELMLTPESKALRELFFRMTANKKHPWKEQARPVQTLGMIGAGFMGAGITEVSITRGMDVLLKDIHPEGIAEAKKGIWKSLKKKIRYRSISKVEAETIMGRVRGQLSYEQFEQADIVIEAVLEKMDLKKHIIADIETHGKEDVIIASNTSSLSIAEMSQHATQPELVIGMHYFSPVPKMPLLEIVRTEHTADWVIGTCYELGLRQGKTCIVVKDSPGFYVNRILSPYMNEALLLLDEGVPMEAIDRAMLKLGFPVGPITLFDQVGLDISAHVVESSKKVVEGREGFEISYGVVKMFEAGRLGRKNKQGFYQYDAKTGKRKKPDPTAYQFFAGAGNQPLPMETIQQRGLMLLVNEAVRCLDEGIIANPVDGDLGAVLGIGFLPFTGGPFSYIDQLGAKEVVRQMEVLAKAYGPKFAPHERLTHMAAAAARFHA